MFKVTQYSPQNAMVQTLWMVASSIEQLKTPTEPYENVFIGAVLLLKIYRVCYTA